MSIRACSANRKSVCFASRRLRVRIPPVSIWAGSSKEERFVGSEEAPGSSPGRVHDGEALRDVRRPHKPAVVGSTPTSVTMLLWGKLASLAGSRPVDMRSNRVRSTCPRSPYGTDSGLSRRRNGFNSRRGRPWVRGANRIAQGPLKPEVVGSSPTEPVGLVSQLGYRAAPRRRKSGVRISSSPCARSLNGESARLLSGAIRVRFSSSACTCRLTRIWRHASNVERLRVRIPSGACMAVWLSVDGECLRSTFKETAAVQIRPPLQPDSVTASMGTLQVLGGSSTLSRAIPRLVQSVEHRAVDPGVDGSNPSAGTRPSVSGRLPHCHCGDSGSIPDGRI